MEGDRTKGGRERGRESKEWKSGIVRKDGMN